MKFSDYLHEFLNEEGYEFKHQIAEESEIKGNRPQLITGFLHEFLFYEDSTNEEHLCIQVLFSEDLNKDPEEIIVNFFGENSRKPILIEFAPIYEEMCNRISEFLDECL